VKLGDRHFSQKTGSDEKSACPLYLMPTTIPHYSRIVPAPALAPPAPPGGGHGQSGYHRPFAPFWGQDGWVNFAGAFVNNPGYEVMIP